MPAPRLTHHRSPRDQYTVRSASCIRNRENRLPQRRSGLLFSTPAPRDRAILSSRRGEGLPSGPLWVPVQRKPHLPPPAHHSKDQRSTGHEGPPLPTRASPCPPWCLAICPQTREAPTGPGWGPEHVELWEYRPGAAQSPGRGSLELGKFRNQTRCLFAVSKDWEGGWLELPGQGQQRGSAEPDLQAHRPRPMDWTCGSEEGGCCGAQQPRGLGGACPRRPPTRAGAENAAGSQSRS